MTNPLDSIRNSIDNVRNSIDNVRSNFCKKELTLISKCNSCGASESRKNGDLCYGEKKSLRTACGKSHIVNIRTDECPKCNTSRIIENEERTHHSTPYKGRNIFGMRKR